MTVTIQSLGEKHLTAFRETCVRIYLDGNCYPFAIALHRALGWPIIGLMHGDIIRHALVQNPEDEIYHDVRGPVAKEEIGDPFDDIFPPYELRPLKEEDLRQVQRTPAESQLTEVFSLRTIRVAEILFPDLPWKDPFQERVYRFAKELETLSRKHGLWIRGTVPTALPLLTEMSENELTGYLLERTGVDGCTFTINSL